LRHLAQDPEAAETAVLIENHSEKDITALRYCWVFIDADGKERRKTTASDSYAVDVYRPVMEPGSRLLVTQIGSVQEALIEHASAGGGFIAAGSISSLDYQVAAEVEFQIDFIRLPMERSSAATSIITERSCNCKLLSSATNQYAPKAGQSRVAVQSAG